MPSSGNRYERLQRPLVLALFAAAMFLWGLAVAFYSAEPTLRYSSVRVSWGVPAAAAVLALVLSLATRRFRMPLAVLLAATAFSAAVALVLGVGTEREAGAVAEAIVRVVEPNDPHAPPVRFWESSSGSHSLRASTFADPELGTRFTPGTQAHEKHVHDYDAVYAIDGEGHRLTVDPRPRLVFVGCSFTFGVGVKDDETYCSRVAQGLSPEIRVVNESTSGWGTCQVYLVSQRYLAQSPPPKAIIYGYISEHLRRNWQRRSFFRFLFPAAKAPAFDVENGSLKYLGLKAHQEFTAPDDAVTDAKEIEVTRALLADLHNRCRQQGCPFAVAALPEGQMRSPDPICEWLPSSGIPWIDLRQASHDFYPHDGHPTPKWHAAMAAALLASPLVQQLRTEHR